ncbi:MAG: peptidase M50 [Actinomycetales bacterium]|nr:MAG: peptidase M50 [Actinomycetales bacterium]
MNGAGSGVQSYGWRVGRVGGVPVYIGRSWPIILVVIVLVFGRVLPVPGPMAYLLAAGYALLLLISVLVHEAGHAIVGRRVGSRVDRVVVTLLGGHTVFGGTDLGPAKSAAVALAGPAGNVVLAGIGWALTSAIDVEQATAAWLLAEAFRLANVLVAAINLLPGLPLDGGHAIAALVWAITGQRATGMIVAGWLGRGVTIGVAGWFLAEPLRSGRAPDLYTMIWVGLIGAFLWHGASRAIQAGHARWMMSSLTVSEVLRPVVAVPAHTTAGAVMQACIDRAEADHVVIVDPAGTPIGFLDRTALGSVPEHEIARVPAVSFLLRPLPGWVVTAEPTDDISVVASSLAGHVEGQTRKDAVLIRGSDGRLVGTVSLVDVNQALQAL